MSLSQLAVTRIFVNGTKKCFYRSPQGLVGFSFFPQASEHMRGESVTLSHLGKVGITTNKRHE